MAVQQSFEILRITAHSDHPVRNSAEDLIFGNHVLWEGDNWEGAKGSLAPNVFSYDFASPLASNSSLNVTIKVIDLELLGAEYRLHGTLRGSNVFESDIFTFTSRDEVTLVARVAEPHSSPDPLTFNGDFMWALEQERSHRKLECTNRTRLELYWVSADIHEIFLAGLSGIPVDFLRSVFASIDSELKTDTSDPKPTTIAATNNWPTVTHSVFFNYSKEYDTVRGASHFGLGPYGGTFDYKYYISAKAGGRQGSLQPIVNCYDQAAMVQVVGSLGTSRPTWLHMKPSGYINPTNLVGIYQKCNNPFYRSTNPPTPPLIGINDRRRTRFDRHVFNGNLAQFHNGGFMRIYDACGGPQVGTQNPVGYLNTTIDKKTTLYTPSTPYGTVSNIKQYAGVVTVLKALPRLDDTEMADNTKMFLQRCDTSASKPHAQVHWEDVAPWAKSVLGGRCEVAFHDSSIGRGVAETLWHLTNVDGIDGDIVVRIRTETCVDEDGNLHFEKSAQMAFEDFAFLLRNIELDLGPNDEGIDTIYAPAPFADYAQYALQHAAHIPDGYFLVVSGNHVISISGGSSSGALEPVVRKLLAHTTVDKPFSLHIPVVTELWYKIPEARRGGSNETVKGIASTLDVKCQVDGSVAAARADVEGHGLLLSKVDIDGNQADKTSTVTFKFVTRAVGTHDVDLHFKHSPTMTTGTKSIQITVVDV